MKLKYVIESYNLFNLPEQSILPGETAWYLEIQYKKIGKLILVMPLFVVNNLDQKFNELKFKKSKRRYKMSHTKMREPSVSAVIGECKLENDHSNEIREGDILVLDKKATDPIDIKSKGKTIALGYPVIVGEHVGIRVIRKIP